MAKVIFKCPHFKSDSSSKHLDYLVKYISTRDGVEKSEINNELPTTRVQEVLIGKILKDFPNSKNSIEYKTYTELDTIQSASEFITNTLENNFDKVAKKDNYVKYIATRPNAEKIINHGLFNMVDDEIDLNKVSKEIANHKGVVWTPIISLKREDATRVGFDNATQWKLFLRLYAMEMSEHFKIDFENFRWYAAFHNEGNHPHVHMVCYSADEKSGFLNQQGIDNIMKGLVNGIFKEDMKQIYIDKSKARDELKKQTADLFKIMAEDLQNNNCDYPKLEELIFKLRDELQNTKGKKQYGYLKPELKNIVDNIVDQLENIPTVKNAYNSWYEFRNEIHYSYSDAPPDQVSLSKQEDFKSIKNMIIKEVANLNIDKQVIADYINVDDNGTDYEFNFEVNADDELIFEYTGDDAQDYIVDDVEMEFEQNTDKKFHKSWSKQYKLAKKYLYGDKENNIQKDFDKAFQLMENEANKNNALAIYDLATFYTRGIGTEKDLDKADELYSLALTAFKQLEKEKPDKSTQYKIGKMYLQGLGTEKSIDDAIKWLTLSSNQGYKYAQYSLASLYHREESVKDIEKAFELYKLSADQDFCYAQYEVGKMFKDGEGTQVDEILSQEYFAKAFVNFVAMDKKDPDDKLQYRIGAMCRDGIGAEINIQKAIEYFEKAAYVGNDQAIYSLAKIYLSDELGHQDIEKGLFMLKTSANNGNEFAQYKLGALFFSEIA